MSCYEIYFLIESKNYLIGSQRILMTNLLNQKTNLETVHIHLFQSLYTKLEFEYRNNLPKIQNI